MKSTNESHFCDDQNVESQISTIARISMYYTVAQMDRLSCHSTKQKTLEQDRFWQEEHEFRLRYIVCVICLWHQKGGINQTEGSESVELRELTSTLVHLHLEGAH